MSKHLTALCLAVLFFTSPIALASFQGMDPREAGWSEAVPLIQDGEPGGDLPRIAVDRQGRVHFLWVSILPPIGGAPVSDEVHAVVYRRLDGDEWTPSNDVLLSPGGGGLILGSVAVDDRDYLNVLWFDQGATRELFLSQAHSSLADDTQHWATVLLESPALAMNGPDLVLEAGGKMHVVYALDNASIVYLFSDDYGDTWSNPKAIWAVSNSQVEAATNPRIAIDARGYLHVVWTVNTRERDWQGNAAFYARSTDGGDRWSSQEVERSLPDEPTTAWINVAVREGNEIHLLWNRGVGAVQGRFHSWSPDNGDSWYEPVAFLPAGVSGQTEWPMIAEDSAGVLHLITVADEPGGPTSPKYAYWNGSSWSPMYSFPESSNDLNAKLAIGLGDTLHLVHPTERVVGAGRSGGSRLLYRTLKTGSNSVQTEQIPDPVVSATTPRETPTPQPTATIAVAPATPRATFESELPELPGNASFARTLALSLVPVGLLLLIVLVWARLRHRA
jgi:hypothetical protein